VCGDENVKLDPGDPILDGVNPEGGMEVPFDYRGMSPYRTIGVKVIDDGGGAPPANPSSIPSRLIFYHLDHLGSPRVELDENGVVLAVHHFLPFGDQRPGQTDPTLSARAFTGHQRDTESGLDYMMARYYSSSLGRFTAVDPGDDANQQEPQSWNGYVYVRDNPIDSTDPTGQLSKELHAQFSANVLGGMGFDSGAIARIVEANVRQDYYHTGSRVAWHAHATGWGSTAGIRANAQRYADKQMLKAVRAAQAGDEDGAYRYLGKGVHTIQDLVSHRNFPNLIKTFFLLQAEHSDNDEHPSLDDAAQMYSDSRAYFQRFLDAVGGMPQGHPGSATGSEGTGGEGCSSGNSSNEPTAEWYKQRALPGASNIPSDNPGR
jgi:RHS repeat-associated protein